jgi:hypothetical protein
MTRQGGISATNDITTVPLLVRQSGSVDLDRVIAALSDLAWLGRQSDGPAARSDRRRIATDLELPIRDGSAPGPVRTATYIDIGLAHLIGEHVFVEIAWQSALAAPLFPVFAGELRISVDGIVLDGRYAPPLGTLGLLLDRALLHFVARRTAGALLARLANHFASSARDAGSASTDDP